MPRYTTSGESYGNTVSKAFVRVFTSPLPRNERLSLALIFVRITQQQAPRERVYQAVA
jgi:hypothetical protein